MKNRITDAALINAKKLAFVFKLPIDAIFPARDGYGSACIRVDREGKSSLLTIQPEGDEVWICITRPGERDQHCSFPLPPSPTALGNIHKEIF